MRPRPVTESATISLPNASLKKLISCNVFVCAWPCTIARLSPNADVSALSVPHSQNSQNTPCVPPAASPPIHPNAQENNRPLLQFLCQLDIFSYSLFLLKHAFLAQKQYFTSFSFLPIIADYCKISFGIFISFFGTITSRCFSQLNNESIELGLSTHSLYCWLVIPKNSSNVSSPVYSSCH